MIGPSEAGGEEDVGIGKELGVEEAGGGSGKEPVVVCEEGGERGEGGAGVGQELGGTEAGTSGRGEDLVGGGGAKGVQSGRPQEGGRGEVEVGDEGLVGGEQVEGVELSMVSGRIVGVVEGGRERERERGEREGSSPRRAECIG